VEENQMIDASSTDRQNAREIMVAYIAALGTTATLLFRESESKITTKNFSETWETILKTVSDHN
jgi:hypothetical protein